MTREDHVEVLTTSAEGNYAGDEHTHGTNNGIGNASILLIDKYNNNQEQAKSTALHHAPAWHRARTSTAIFTNFAIIMERTDEQILPAVYRFLGESFKASPSQLGVLTLSRALTQALASPLGGLLGHYINRIWVLSVGCILWGICTAGFCFTHSVNAISLLLWAITGIGLALVVPNVQSITADFFSEKNRGKAFGLLQMTSLLGGSLGAIYATNMGSLQPFGIEGWRVAFFSVAMVSIVIGVCNFLFSRDPRYVDEVDDGCFGARSRAGALATIRGLRNGSSHGGVNVEQHAGATPSGDGFHQVAAAAPVVGVWETMVEIKAVMTIPTFLIIIVQGIVGTLPANALAFITLYLQLLGMSDFQASLITALFLAGQAFGGPLGGWLGDKASRRFPNHGRIFVCQISVAAGIPFTFLLLKVLPTEAFPSTMLLWSVSVVAMGLMIAWPAPACNNPIFAEIVPPSMRNMIYAFDRSFEGALAACGAPLVGLLAEKLFGFEGSAAAGGPHDRQNAQALNNALLVMTIIPWTVCLICYSGLHFSYPKDKLTASRNISTRLSQRLSQQDFSEQVSSQRPITSYPVLMMGVRSEDMATISSVDGGELGRLESGLEVPLLDDQHNCSP